MIETAKRIVDKLKSRNERIAIAESLTGGAITSALTDIPGTSHVLIGAIVAYSTDIKIRELGVSPESISKFGVVSQEVVLQMVHEKLGDRQETTPDKPYTIDDVVPLKTRNSIMHSGDIHLQRLVEKEAIRLACFDE